MRQWFAIFRQLGKLPEVMARTGKQFVRVRRIERQRQVFAFRFVKLRPSQLHARVQPVQSDAGPGHIHGRRIRD